MYYKIFIGDTNLPFYVKCDSFRTFVSTVTPKVDIIVDAVVEPEDIPYGEILPVIVCEIINPQTNF